MMDDDEMNYFFHFYTKAFRELGDNTVSTFCFYFFQLLFCSLHACFFKNGRVLKFCAETLHFSKGNKGPEK